MSCPYCENKTCFIFQHQILCLECNNLISYADSQNMYLVCPRCEKYPFSKTYSTEGFAEVWISGLCEECFDYITSEFDEEDREEMELLKIQKGNENPEEEPF